MLTIKNLTKRTVIFNLPHEDACSPTVCTCSRAKTGVVDHDKATGDRKVRAVNQRLAHAITLFPKGTKGDDGKTPLDERSNLLDGVGSVLAIQQAKARGEILVTFTANEAPPAAPVEATPEAAPAATSSQPAYTTEAAMESPKFSKKSKE